VALGLADFALIELGSCILLPLETKAVGIIPRINEVGDPILVVEFLAAVATTISRGRHFKRAPAIRATETV
jgi:hypothetical protein